MGLVVQKFGGSSVANLEKLELVSNHIIKEIEKGNKVVVVVSAATRPYGSSVKIASRIASEIWSQILSGCPSETDSDVKRCFAIFNIT